MSPLKHKPLLLPRIIRYASLSGLLLIGLWYVVFQARYLIAGPEVTLSPEPAIVHSERVIELSGVARNITALYVNGRSIGTDPEGNFTEAVVLENGYTILSVDARDRYGRTVHIERPLVYAPNEEVAAGDLSFSDSD